MAAATDDVEPTYEKQKESRNSQIQPQLLGVQRRFVVAQRNKNHRTKLQNEVNTGQTGRFRGTATTSKPSTEKCCLQLLNK